MYNNERYDYYQALRNDLFDVLDDYREGSSYDWMTDDIDEIYDEVYDFAWTDDQVTGNGSGSYFYDRSKAEEAISGNWDLVGDAVEEFDATDTLKDGPEAIDVTIRCYLLSEICGEVVKEYINKLRGE